MQEQRGIGHTGMGSHLQGLAALFRELAMEKRASPQARPGDTRLPETLLDAIDVVIFVTDSDGAWRYLSAPWIRLSGFAVEELVGAGMLKSFHPNDHAEVREYLDGCGRRTEGVVVRCLTRGGESLRVELRAQAVTDSAGKRLGFVGTLADVTLRSQADSLKQASHRTLETLINNLPGMVYRGRNNPQWTMEFVSDGCRALTGYPPEAFINNRQVAFAELIFAEDRQMVWDDVQSAIREDRPFELTYRIHTAQGEEKWVLERGRGILSTSGELLGLEGFITDITAEKRAELRQARVALYESVTNQPMRALFLDRLTRALTRSHSHAGAACSVLLVGIDRFAKLHAQFGADSGDRIALEIGRRIAALLGPLDSLCRWRDDEFAILLERPELATAVAEQVLEALRAPIVDRQTEVFVTASIGIAPRAGTHQRAEDLLREAGSAMARAREIGGARFEVVTCGPGSKVGAPV